MILQNYLICPSVPLRCLFLSKKTKLHTPHSFLGIQNVSFLQSINRNMISHLKIACGSFVLSIHYDTKILLTMGFSMLVEIDIITATKVRSIQIYIFPLSVHNASTLTPQSILPFSLFFFFFCFTTDVQKS